MLDFGKYVEDHKDRVYRLFVYKKVYTPYEEDKKFSDESMFENGGYGIFVKIDEIFKLPDNEVYIRFKVLDEDDVQDKFKATQKTDTKCTAYMYEKLSDIKLQEFSTDNE